MENMSLQDAVAISSIYLALFSILSTIFLVQITQWLNNILAIEAKWQRIQGRPNETFYDKKLECYYEIAQAESPWTFIGWAVVTIFLVIVGLFSENLRSQLNSDISTTILNYVSWPSYLFFIFFLVLSVIMLVIGYKNSRSLKEDIKKEL